MEISFLPDRIIKSNCTAVTKEMIYHVIVDLERNLKNQLSAINPKSWGWSGWFTVASESAQHFVSAEISCWSICQKSFESLLYYLKMFSALFTDLDVVHGNE